MEPIEKTLETKIEKSDSSYKAPSSAFRSIAFDNRKKVGYQIQKGLKKPGRVTFDVLRRASYAVHVARICINVLKEKVTKTKWVIQNIDGMDSDRNDPRIKEVESLIKHPNQNNETFRTLLDKILEDLLVLDAVAIEKTRYPDGKLAELHYVDAATIRPVYDIHGNQDVEIPLNTKDGMEVLPVSYVQVLNNTQYGGPESGEMVGAWPKKDFMYFNMHPQGSMEGFGYGMSPLESVLSVVSNILNADNYNGTYFEDGAFPPILLQFMSNMQQNDLETMREYLYNELQGNFHKPAVFAGANEIKVTNLKDLTNRDMEFMEYMKFMARLLSAAYGLSGQDIGLTDDLNRATSEVQKDLSEAKGYGSILHLLKEVINQEIIWKDFGYEDLEFDWVAPDSMDPSASMEIYSKGLQSGIYTLNEVRQKLGENPFGEYADNPMVLTGEGYKPLIAAKEPEQKESTGKESLETKEINPANMKGNKEKVGGEKPYNEQDDNNKITKSERKTWIRDVIDSFMGKLEDWGMLNDSQGNGKTIEAEEDKPENQVTNLEVPAIKRFVEVGNSSFITPEMVENDFIQAKDKKELLEKGYQEKIYSYTKTESERRLSEYIKNNPNQVGGVFIEKDLRGEKFTILVKNGKLS